MRVPCRLCLLYGPVEMAVLLVERVRMSRYTLAYFKGDVAVVVMLYNPTLLVARVRPLRCI
jgi:hypothetical protein